MEKGVIQEGLAMGFTDLAGSHWSVLLLYKLMAANLNPAPGSVYNWCPVTFPGRLWVQIPLDVTVRHLKPECSRCAGC